MEKVQTLLLILVVAASSAEPQDYRTTPVPILKQINRQNDDGSYSFGYEAADGSFKIETKYPTGEVVGKYGYVGDDGKVRQVEYGASKRGFEPSGSHIYVPPPALAKDGPPGSQLEYDDGQYREDPSIYDKPSGHRFAPARPTIQDYQTYQYRSPLQNYQSPLQKYQATQQQQSALPNYLTAHYQSPLQKFKAQTSQNNYLFQSQYQATPRPEIQSHPIASFPAQYQRPIQIQQARQYNQAVPDFNKFLFKGHPASNFNLFTGSYSLSY